MITCSNPESETGVVLLDEDGKPEERVEIAFKGLPEYDPVKSWNSDSSPFRYWKIRDYAYAYRSKLTTPSIVSIYRVTALLFVSVTINLLIEIIL